MRIGIPREIKADEHRVSLPPESVRELCRRQHTVMVESGAGLGAGLTDDAYQNAGATIIGDPAMLFAEAELIIKVKEPQPVEIARLRRGQMLFTYLHLGADRVQTEALCQSGVVAIGYETVTDQTGRLPLLTPMSEIAGRMAAQAGAYFLEKHSGGRGILLSGVPGVVPGRVMIIGGGVVGSNAARIACGMGADVVILDNSVERLRQLDREFGGRLKTLVATDSAIDQSLSEADLVIGAVLVPGAAAPKLIRREHLSLMKQGSVLVDVAIDQGGCAETSRATTHHNPTYIVDGIVHYCVANMPGGVARTSTFALANATLPYIITLAEKGWRRTFAEDPLFRQGLNIAEGHITYPNVAKSLGLSYTAVDDVLKAA